MKITSMSQQNKLLSHLKMFILAMSTAVVLPSPSKAGLRRAQDSALSQSGVWGWARAHGSSRRLCGAMLVMAVGALDGALCLTCLAD